MHISFLVLFILLICLGSEYKKNFFQGETFWKKFTITFRSFTNRHGVIKEIANNSAKFEDFIDQAFIFIHENFVEGIRNKSEFDLDDNMQYTSNISMVQ